MSTDRHLDDNADDQTRIPANPRSTVPPGAAPTQHRPDPLGEDLAEQLVDVAETAAAGELVDQTITRVAEELSPAPDLDFAEAIAGMANRHLQEAGLALEVVEACAGCGCTNRHACILDNPRSIGGGMHVRTCHWISTPAGEPPRCSKCGPTPEAYDSAPATLMGIRINIDETIPEGEVQLRDAGGKTLMRIVDIEQPTEEEGAQALALAAGDHEPFLYAASATVATRRAEEPEPGIFGSQNIADALCPGCGKALDDHPPGPPCPPPAAPGRSHG